MSEAAPVDVGIEAKRRHDALHEKLFARVRKNVGILLSGNALSQAIGFVAVAVNARALGVEGLGAIALLQALSAVVGRVFSFDTWQPVVKLGAGPLAAGELDEVGAVIRTGLTYDAAAAAAAAFTGCLVVLLAGPYFGIESKLRESALIWMVATLGIAFTGGAGSAAGALRLFDKFGILTTVQVATAAVNLAGSLILWGLDAPLSGYILMYASTLVCSQWSMLIIAVRKMRERGIDIVASRPARRDHLSAEFRRFAWSGSATSLINSARLNADTFLLGLFAGPASIGLYSVAKKLATIVNLIAEAGRQSVFLEIASLVADQNHDAAKRLVVQLGMIGAGISTALLMGAAILGPWFLSFAFGKEFGAAYAPFLILTASSCIYLIGFPLGGFVQSTAGPQALARIFVIAFVISAPIGIYSIHEFKLIGAGIGQVVFMAIWFVSCVATIRNHINQISVRSI